MSIHPDDAPRKAWVISDVLSLGGAGVWITDLTEAGLRPEIGPGVVRVGIHRAGPAPLDVAEDFDILLSVEPNVGRPWVYCSQPQLGRTLSELETRIQAQPAAAAAVVQVLRVTLALTFEQALVLESTAYSMLLASGGFRRWRAANPPRERPFDGRPRVKVQMQEGILSLRLDRPSARNAFDAAMRDDLVEALTFAQIHPDQPSVELSGAGPAFSAGGDLDEFGRANDVGEAHLIRVLRSPASLLRGLGERATARLHGDCIGAGIEMPAAAARVIAQPGSTFRLPEVSMGLIPGAGGTATISRRIGRHRCAYMAVSGASIDLATALAWALVDEEDAGT